MSKRSSKDGKNNYYSPAKKQKLDITVGNASKTNNKKTVNKNQEYNWGDDFQEEDLQEIDLVITQELSQVVNSSFVERFTPAVENASTKPVRNWSVPSFDVKSHNPSPKKNPTVIFPKPSTSSCSSQESNLVKLKNREPTRSFPENKSTYTNQYSKAVNINKKSSPPNGNSTFIQSTQEGFGNFKRNLLDGENMNSTFLSQKSIVVVSDDSQSLQISKLKEDKNMLINQVTTREGEVSFLRKMLQREQQKLADERLEKSKLLEEQENKHKEELMDLKKKNDKLAAELNFQYLQISDLKGKTKMLEKASVKFIEPHSANFDSGKKRIIINRPGSSAKMNSKECATQIEVFDKAVFKKNDPIIIYPLKAIPESIFESSEPEKSVIGMHVIEKVGERNLPILQEADNLRIFENTELVKPVVSYVDNKQLCVQFFSSNLSRLIKKTSEEINSSEGIPTINMIIATARELLLNSLTSLKKLLDAMKNDDVRDMDDFYLSEYSTITISHADNICCAKKLYEKERGIEARRSLAVLSYIVSSSTYLGEYITGKRQLKVDEDCSYRYYIQQLRTYNSWSNKDCEFEFLEMILQFVTVMGLTRRAHQFCGVINAIVSILNNAQKSVGFCSKGLNYIFKIFREIVFSRPILECIPAISEMMMTFDNCTEFSGKVCVNPKSANISLSNDIWCFKPESNTCTLEIFITQVLKFIKDPIILMNTTYAVVSFLETIISMNILSWTEGQQFSCKCYTIITNFAVKSLYKCTKINVDNLEAKFQNLVISNDTLKIPDRDFWYKLRRKQKDIFIKGVQFLSLILTRQSEYILRRPEIVNPLSLFLHHVKNTPNLRLPENDSDIMEKLEIVKHEEKMVESYRSRIYLIENPREFGRSIDRSSASRAKSIHESRRRFKRLINFPNS